MINSEKVYCIECDSIIAKRIAEKIFKTGFYRTTIPLAHCKECAYTENQKLDVEIEIINTTKECYSDYGLPLLL